ncbi:MAG: HD domain-containing phosphohydrolase [Thermoanaerobaculia bacterium]|nr:HD domain-containing phosphohydrolase [Thermoanaerobaculia bacterium]
MASDESVETLQIEELDRGMLRTPSGTPTSLMERQLRAYARDLRRVLQQERRAAAELRDAYMDTFRRLLSVVSCCHHETARHLERIGAYVEVMAGGLGLEEAEVGSLARASVLHDIGKLGIPRGILNKPGPLNAEERRTVETHTTLGERILDGSPSPDVQLSAVIAASHHENWDGSGYPRGLSGESIPLAGRIVRLADQYDALRSARPYKRAFTHEEASRVILEGDDRTSPSHFDPGLLDVYRRLHPEFARLCREIGPN